MKLKNILHSLILFIIISILITTPALAEELSWDQYPCVSPESVLLPPSQKESKILYTPYYRGDIIAAARLGISNEGQGKIGVTAQTLMHKPVDKVRMKIYLDKWVADDERWATIDDWDFTFLKTDNPNEDLTIANINFKVINQEKDCYYRLRGLHVVWLNGGSEGFSTETHGVLITD